jgi:hypothetical protein
MSSGSSGSDCECDELTTLSPTKCTILFPDILYYNTTLNTPTCFDPSTFLWYTHNALTMYSFVHWIEKCLFGCMNDESVTNWRTRFNARAVWFVMDKVALGQVFSYVIWLYPASYHFTNGPYSYSFICHLHCLLWILMALLNKPQN